MDLIKKRISSYKPNKYCWNMSKITERFKTYDMELGHPFIKVAVLDSGCDYLHSEIKDNILIEKSKSLVPYEDNLEDYIGHGTAVISSIVGKKNVKGIAPAISIINYKIVDKNGYGQIKWIINAIKLAIQEDVHIINISYISKKIEDKILIRKYREVIEEANRKGIYIVCSAGNDFEEIVEGYDKMPVLFPNVIAIASTDYRGNLSSFSNYGEIIEFSIPSGGFLDEQSIHQYEFIIVAKPHTVERLLFEEIYQIPNEYTLTMGTSISSAIFSGTIALLISKYYRLHITLPEKEEILNVIKLTGKKVNQYFSMVEVNAYQALKKIK